MYRASWKSLVTALALSASLAACATAAPPSDRVYVRVAPPRDRVEVIATAPGRDFVWVGGHWRWDGNDWDWVPGRWIRLERGYRAWVPGHWRHDRFGWYWVEGHWR